MAQEAAVPLSTVKELARQIAREEVAKFARSGFLRNASISGGDGLTIKDGGALRLETAAGVESFYVGPVQPDLPDGSPQPGMIVRRNDGTIALHLYDPIPSAEDYNQFLAWRDRAGNVVISDDTDSGQGLARPYLAGAFYPARVQDFLKTTNPAFETIWRERRQKQHPKLYVEAWGATDTSGTTGEVRVMVNGVQLGATQSATAGVVTQYLFGPAAIDGGFGANLSVEIQARRSAGTGNVQVGAAWVDGRQS
ncbi:hypothetical protein QOZ88_06010 [Blastococcus sp. BMG 814]|uniref:Uncharacterized protein n=1 Tax=Blastococcus carthaginiensis TaxID=3050034 RepID=A0ABT9IAP5_9ACTN|nr:hypothetical protein [Blastococcus carthaginiensis]MDP5182185.1 hypothetical protein [Blastococcus carthaginiensis]